VRSATTENLLSTYTGPAQVIFTLTWSPNGKYIAAGTADGMVQIWDAGGGRAPVIYHGHTAEVETLTWSPDSKYIASGSADGTVQVWNAATRQTLFTYRGHSGAVNSVAWQPGSRLAAGQYARIASGGADSTAQIWSLGQIDSSNPVQSISLQGETLIYRGHSAQVLSVVWSPDGQKVASGSEDGTVQIWRAI
jgi:WD40 repeat protein